MIGDAAFLAHYRLGVGVNAIFTTAQLLPRLLRRRSVPSTHRALVEGNYSVKALAVDAQEVVDGFVDLQLSTMFFESYCDLIVFFNNDPSAGAVDVLHSQVLYVREPQHDDYVLPPWQHTRQWRWAGGDANTWPARAQKTAAVAEAALAREQRAHSAGAANGEEEQEEDEKDMHEKGGGLLRASGGAVGHNNSAWLWQRSRRLCSK